MSSKDIGPRKSNQYESQLILTPPQENSSRKLGNCKAAPRGSNLPIEAICRFIKQTAMKPRHKLLLRMMADYYARFKKICPSMRRLAADCGVSRNAVCRWIRELEQLGFIRTENCFRRNGGKTSNLYSFTTKLLHGHAPRSSHQVSRKEETVKHVAKPNVKPKKCYHIKADEMRSAAVCQKHYENAVERRWVADSDNEHLLFFTLWGTALRKYREGKIRSPGAWFSALLKRGLHRVVGTADDEHKAAKALIYLRKCVN